MAVQIVKAITNSNILIMDVDDKKLKEVKKLGADMTINSLPSDSVKALKNLTIGKRGEGLVDFVKK